MEYTYSRTVRNVKAVAGVDRKGRQIALRNRTVMINKRIDSLGTETLTSVTVLSDSGHNAKAETRIDASGLIALG